MNTKHFPIVLAAALAFSAPGSGARAEAQNRVLPAETTLPSDPAAAPRSPASTLAAPQMQGDVRYVDGGVGEAEAAAVRAQAPNYTLQLLLHGRQGEYVVADQVTIRRGDDTVLSLQDAGPYVLADLSPGRYTVETTYQGRTQTKSVEVGRHLTHVDMAWKSDR